MNKGSRALEEKMHNIWLSGFKNREFRNKKIRVAFENLNKWRLLSHLLMEKYCDEQIGIPYANKQRLVFENKFDYFLNSGGEAILLTGDLLRIFSKKRLSIFIKNLPIFVQLKSVPCFWINGGIITVWNFYFKEAKIKTSLEEIMKFSNKIFIFSRIEFSEWNFIQTYSSKPDKIFLFSKLKVENEELINTLEKYLTKDFWIIPQNSLKEINPFCITVFNEGILLPCIPHRVVFKVLKKGKIRSVRFFDREIKYLEFFVSYINASKEISTDIIYLPLGVFKTKLETGKIYNGLIFSFIDFNTEWIYPFLFSFYEEDLSSHEIFQELLLIIIRNHYIKSNTFFSVDVPTNQLQEEMWKFANILWRKRFLKFSDAFSRLDKKNIMEIIFSSLYPILAEYNNKIFYIPLPLGLLGVDRNTLIQFVIEYEKYIQKIKSAKTISDRNKIFIDFCFYVSDIFKRNTSLAGELIRNIRQRILFIEYIKEMVSRIEVSKS